MKRPGLHSQSGPRPSLPGQHLGCGLLPASLRVAWRQRALRQPLESKRIAEGPSLVSGLLGRETLPVLCARLLGLDLACPALQSLEALWAIFALGLGDLPERRALDVAADDDVGAFPPPLLPVQSGAEFLDEILEKAEPSLLHQVGELPGNRAPPLLREPGAEPDRLVEVLGDAHQGIDLPPELRILGVKPIEGFIEHLVRDLSVDQGHLDFSQLVHTAS